MENPVVNVVHKSIPSKFHTAFLAEINYLECFIEKWSAKRTFDESVVMSDDAGKDLCRASVTVSL